MSKNSNKYLLALNSFNKLGPVRLKRLKNFFPSWQMAWQANRQELLKAGLEEHICDEFISFRLNVNPDNILASLEKEKIKTISLKDENYPTLLKEIYNPPVILYYRGKIANKQTNIALVGSRKNSVYGQQAAEKIAYGLAVNNFCVVSGLAVGIDAIAHQSALNAGGKTIAVLATGIDKQSIYPFGNRYLAEKIISSEGLIVSEFPPGTPPLKHHFPQRNRIISGLSAGVVAVEAQKKSGALITIQTALEQNREVFAVPGNIFSSTSEGTNNIIKEGAKLVTSAEDIIETLDLVPVNDYINTNEFKAESKEEKLLLSQLSLEPLHIDELIRKTKLKTAKVAATISLMEVKGMVKNLGNMLYVLNK